MPDYDGSIIISTELDTSGAEDSLQTLAGELTATLRETAEQFPEIGRAMADGVASGLRDGVESVTRASNELAAASLSQLKNQLGIHSPSKVFQEEIGRRITEGWAQGIRDGSSLVDGALRYVGQESITNIKSYILAYQRVFAVSPDEQIRTWQTLGEQYKAGTRERAECDNQLPSALRDQLRERQSLEKMTAAEVAAYWEENSRLFTEGTRAQADAAALLAKARVEAAEEAAKAEARAAEDRAKTEEAARAALERTEKLKASLMADSQARMQKQLEEYTAAYARMIDEITALETGYQSAVTGRTSQLLNATGLFDDVNTRQVSGVSLSGNLTRQVAELREYGALMDSLSARGVDDSLLSELRNLGPNAVSELRAISGMTDQELDHYVDLWREKYQLAGEQAIAELEELRAETDAQIATLKNDFLAQFAGLPATMYTIGMQVGQGLAAGIAAGSALAVSAATAMASETVYQSKKRYGIASPSKVFREIGGQLTEGLALGVEDGAGKVTQRISAALDTPAAAILAPAYSAVQAAQASLTPLSATTGVLAASVAQGSGTSSAPSEAALATAPRVEVTVSAKGNLRPVVEALGFEIERVRYLKGVGL